MNLNPLRHPFALLVCAAGAIHQPPLPAQESSTGAGSQEVQNIEAALIESTAAAKTYEFQPHDGSRSFRWQKQPILRWSNPEVGQIYGNVFLWTEDGRPRVVGSLFRWFSPHTHTSHEFQSLSTTPIASLRAGRPVWRTTEPGVSFAPIPEAGPVATEPGRRLLQMRELARQFSAQSTDREGQKYELRRLTQPVYRYEALPSKSDIADGALFVFVRGTDPEVWLLIEAQRNNGGAEARWEFAFARMNSIEFAATHNGKSVWNRDMLPFSDVGAHKSTYTSFRFDRN